MKWSGPGGVNMIDSLLWWGSVVYVHHIKEMDCTAMFATGAI